MSWYRTGTVSVTNGSAVVTGSGTAWIQPVRISDAFQGPDGRVYEITQVTSNTSLTISPAYLGSTGAGQAYAIQPTRGVTIDFNNNAVALLAAVQSYIDGALAGRFPNGTAALPALSFTADPDTGIYRIGANQLGFSEGGVDRGRLYGAKNILGTVSQTGGIPTGAIIQRGSNANGEFVRFADGTQICWGTAGSGSDGLGTTRTLPAAFANNAYQVTVSPKSNFARMGVAFDQTATTFKAQSYADNGVASSTSLAFVAIGPWYQG